MRIIAGKALTERVQKGILPGVKTIMQMELAGEGSTDLSGGSQRTASWGLDNPEMAPHPSRQRIG